MSFHNPYLSASRPSSSFTRSSRSSKRNDPSINKSSYLSRSRSSVALGGGSQSLLSTQAPSSAYHLDTSSAYVPGSWNRSSSTNRLTRQNSSNVTPSALTTFVPGSTGPPASQSSLLNQNQQVQTRSQISTVSFLQNQFYVTFLQEHKIYSS